MPQTLVHFSQEEVQKIKALKHILNISNRSDVIRMATLEFLEKHAAKIQAGANGKNK